MWGACPPEKGQCPVVEVGLGFRAGGGESVPTAKHDQGVREDGVWDGMKPDPKPELKMPERSRERGQKGVCWEGAGNPSSGEV